MHCPACGGETAYGPRSVAEWFQEVRVEYAKKLLIS